MNRSLLTNGSLYFASVHQTRNERPDEGVYQCLVTLPLVGTLVSRWAKLQISALPRFEAEPRDVIVRVGDTARFNCYVASGASSAASLHFTWLKDERPLNVDPARMSILPSGALELDDVQLLDQGYYRCNVSNGDKFRISTDAKLSVLSELEGGGRPEAPSFLATPRNTVALERSNVTLECAANGTLWKYSNEIKSVGAIAPGQKCRASPRSREKYLKFVTKKIKLQCKHNFYAHSACEQ